MNNIRWVYLMAAVLLLMCTGSIYAFSVFAGPLAAERGWTMAQVMLAFGISAAVAPIPMIIGGKVVDKGYAREAMLAGGVCFGLAFLAIGYLPSLAALYLGYGVMGGIGISFAYAGALGNATRYFPDKRGMATGLVTAGNGAAAVITAPLAAWLIAGHGVLHTLQYLGYGFLVIAIVCGLITRSAPQNYRPPGWTPPTSANGAAQTESLDWKGMLATPVFYLLLALMASGALAGLMIAANASLIGQNMFGLSAVVAAGYVGAYAAGNASGRFLWGAISDRIGGANALTGIFVLIGAMLAVLATSHATLGFAIGIVGMGIAFGGIMGVFPSLVSARFGTRYFGVNYGIMFCGYAVAAFFGPRLGASIAASNNGNYDRAFYVAMAVCLVGLVLSLVLSSIVRRRRVVTLHAATVGKGL